MKNYGSTVRQIRLSKGFSHKEIYTGILSKSFAIDFEKGLYDIKFNLMLKIHPDIIIGKKSDSPDEDKSLADSKALIPVLKYFFRKHPLINPKPSWVMQLSIPLKSINTSWRTLPLKKHTSPLTEESPFRMPAVR